MRREDEDVTSQKETAGVILLAVLANALFFFTLLTASPTLSHGGSLAAAFCAIPVVWLVFRRIRALRTANADGTLRQRIVLAASWLAWVALPTVAGVSDPIGVPGNAAPWLFYLAGSVLATFVALHAPGGSPATGKTR